MTNDSGGKTILLVEDEAIVAIDQRRMLEQYGYHVVIANTGERAVQTVQNSTDIDLVLMDINLGSGIEGTEAARLILQIRDLPVVFLSSHVEPGIVQKTQKITSYGYVVKNSGITVLDTSIKMAFRLFEANRKLMESEARQKAMISNISDVISIVDGEGIIKYKSPNVEKWFGWKSEELVGQHYWRSVHPDDCKQLQARFAALLATPGASDTVEFRYHCKGGGSKPVELTAVNLTHDPIIRGVLVNYHDISDRKRSEDALRGSEERFRALYDHAPLGYQSLDKDGRLLTVNPMWLQTLGYNREEVIGAWFGDFLAQEYVPAFRTRFETFKAVGWVHTEFQMIHKGGSRRIIEFEGRIGTDENGAFKQTHCILSDVTERRAAEERLRESERKFHLAVESAPVPIMLHDEDGRVLQLSRGWTRFSGYSIEDIPTQADWTERAFGQSDGPGKEYIDGLFAIDKTVAGGEWNVTAKDGTTRIWDFQTTPLGQVHEGRRVLLSMATDITERKQAEKALSESQERLSLATRGAGIGVWDYYPKEDRLEWDEGTFALFGARPENFGHNHQSWTRFLLPDAYAEVDAQFQVALKTRDEISIEYPIRRADGEIRYLASVAHIYRDEQNQAVRVIGVHHDITKSVVSEKQLTESIAEKEVLLREMHHRVKNNLHVISSLLSLQSASVHTPAQAMAAFKNSRDRVIAMSLVHDELSRAQAAGSVNASSYMEKIARQLQRAYGTNERVKLTVDMEEVVMGADNSFSCGLILNELVTNAFKYAFPPGSSGEIHVQLRVDGEGLVELSVRDNGCGFEHDHLRSSEGSLGLTLVRLLSGQLGGTMELFQESGTCCSVRFPAEPLRQTVASGSGGGAAKTHVSG